MSWASLEDGAPALARFGAERLSSRIAYLATVDDSGTPRVHPVTPILAPGSLFLFMESSSPKAHDLERGSRYALHCAVEDPNGGGGEFRVRGGATLVENPDRRAFVSRHASYEPSDSYILFELSVNEAFSTLYEDGRPTRSVWRALGRQ